MNWILWGLIALIIISIIAFNLRNKAAQNTPEQTAKNETKPDASAPIKRTSKL